MLAELWPELRQAISETLLMLVLGLSIAGVLGLALGTLLYSWGREGARSVRFILLGTSINIVRSFPFVILMIAVTPLSRILTGSSIGPLAATIPLSIAGTAYFARLVELALAEVPRGVVEATIAMGASWRQIVFRTLFVEARSALILAFTALSISYLGYTAAAGIIGGGGVGDLAIRYGYYRFQTDVMLVTVVGLALFVQFIQATGNFLARRLDKRS